MKCWYCGEPVKGGQVEVTISRGGKSKNVLLCVKCGLRLIKEYQEGR